MILSLKYAILGFIEQMPVSGYDLKKMFSTSVSSYWPATHSQIYRTLEQLLQNGFVEQEIITQIDKPNKKVYRLTNKGKDDLINWINIKAELPDLRHKLLIKLSYSKLISNNELIILLEDYKNKISLRLNTYKNFNQNIINSYSNSKKEKFLWQMCLNHGIMYFENEMIWVNEVIDGVNSLLVP